MKKILTQNFNLIEFTHSRFYNDKNQKKVLKSLVTPNPKWTGYISYENKKKSPQ